jgi:SMI1 / KNR4 family (SUKH-1)
MAGEDLIRRDGGPAGASALDEAEEALGVSLPDDYRAFLGRHDGVRLEDNRLEPRRTPTGGADGLYSTAELTRARPPGFPDRLVPIGEAGGGDKIALDGAKVVLWEHETDDVVELAPSFGAWFDALVPLTDDDLPEFTVEEAGVKRGFLKRMRREGKF